MTAQLEKYLSPGVLGFYSHAEIIEISMFDPAEKKSYNVFTVIVATELTAPGLSREYLCPPIRIKRLSDRYFGVERRVWPISELEAAIDRLGCGEGWADAREGQEFGTLTARPLQFVPPDTALPVAWNSLLKNNFWNGSHIAEWVDSKKAYLKPLFDDPRLLQELSAAVEACVPIRLAAMTDRLGNVALQLPVTVITTNFDRHNKPDEFVVRQSWHPMASPRPLQAVCFQEFDDIVSGFAAAEITGQSTRLPMRPGRGIHRGFVWDAQNEIVLAATGSASFINGVALQINAIASEPRTFSVRDANGQTIEHRVSLINSSGSTVGTSEADDVGDWTAKRMYTEQATRLRAERRFVQFPSVPGKDEHDEALKTLRALIAQYGQKGAWLWDPFLNAKDVVDVLFHCPFSNAELRALTSGKEPTVPRAQACLSQIRRWIDQRRGRPPRASFLDRQRKELEHVRGNLLGLRLDYRMQFGQAGWKFHDRFLIFPATSQGALAWSLGTSINSIGREHHILQRVDDGQLIADAFNDLWERLSDPAHLIWKTVR